MNRMITLILTQFIVLLGLLFTSCTAREAETINLVPNQERPRESWSLSTIAEIEERLDQMVFVNSVVGWGIQNGNIVQTMDGGRNWTIRLAATNLLTDFNNLDLKAEFTRLSVLTPSSVLAVNGETIFYTNDGGAKWSKVELKDVTIRDIYFVDKHHGWLIGEKRLAEHSNWTPVLYFTKDLGLSWVETKVNHFSTGNVDTWWDLWADENTGVWLIGSRVLRSSDNGKNWAEVSICPGVSGTPSEVGFFDAGHGWLRTNQGSGFCITSDGGNSWSTRDFPEKLDGVQGVIQVEPHVFWAFGASGAFVSNNGGFDWEKVADGKLTTGQYLREENRLILAGDRIISIRLRFSASS